MNENNPQDNTDRAQYIKRTSIRFILEILSVVIGVFIAFVIDNDQKEKEDIDYVNSVIESISKEFKENKKELEDIIAVHQGVIETLKRHQLDDEVNLSYILSVTDGVRVVQIKNSSWKTFLYPNIRLVNYRVISLLSDIDEDKNILKLQLQKLADFLYQGNNSNMKNRKQTFKLIISDLLNTEKVLLAKHNEFLKEIDNKY